LKGFIVRLLILGIVSALLLISTGCLGLFGPSAAEEKIMLWNGKDFTGWICLQSEGGPIEIRNIYQIPYKM